MKNSYFKSSTVCLLILLITVSCDSTGEGDQSAGEQVTPIAGYELSPRDLSRVVQLSSNIEPENKISIASRMSGLITSLEVREGDTVSEGDVLLRFDLEEQNAELQRARAELELAEARFSRSSQLYEREAISSAEFEETSANYKIAESEVNLRETRVGFGTVRAPDDLIILERHVEEGDAVSVNEPLFQAADINRLVVRVGVPERDVVNINEGQVVDLAIDAFPGKIFAGSVQRVYPSADADSRLVTVEIVLRSEQQDQLIRPGYLARVRLDADRRENILAVPSESLLASGRDERFVYVINSEDRLERRDVVTGIERRNWTQILDGLESGEVIVGGNPGNLRENLYVEVSRWVDEGSPETLSQR